MVAPVVHRIMAESIGSVEQSLSLLLLTRRLQCKPCRNKHLQRHKQLLV